MTIIAIETSCDETSVAIIRDEIILTNIVSSQIADHQKYGGVVPELASRLHLKNIMFVLQTAITQANINLSEIDYVAYTACPGLIGSLHMGKIFAQTIALFLEKPLLPMNHLYGHIYGARIGQNFSFPALALLVSGGHTQLFYLSKELKFQLIGNTLDDAVGECYDKVARLMGLPYPGGPIIDSYAQKGRPTYQLPIAKQDDSLDFSFSGLKSAAANLINKLTMKNEAINQADFCASFQTVVVKQLISKVTLALKKYPNVKTIILAGGVSANSSLRNAIKQLASSERTVIIPKMEYCTDNAAMIAQLAYSDVMLSNK